MEKDRYMIYELDMKNIKGKYLKKHIRTIVHDEQEDKIYIPITDERDFLSASFDGIGILTHDKNPFLPIDWFQKEYPKDGYDKAEKSIRSKILK